MRAVVSLNSGSSSIKFALFTLDDNCTPVLSARGKIESIGIAPSLSIQGAQGEPLHERTWNEGAALTHADLLADLFKWAPGHLEGREVIAIGHRVVHGGTEFAQPRLVDPDLLHALEALCPLAPLHQPHNLAAIRAVAALHPDFPQVACFDTAFHHDKPEIASRLAIPRALHEQGIRRYGFHGLSYEHVTRRLAVLDPGLHAGKVIAAHLGNGASLCAIDAGRSIDTTMGFTALDGLMMGTRCGLLDPGVVLHLQSSLGMRTEEVEKMLYHQSGLLGVSGISSDMRLLHESAAAEAEEAIKLFAWRAAREMGAMASSLGGVSGIVFTAGIGENDADVRGRICRRLEWLGLTLDEAANENNQSLISRPGSQVRVWVIPTDEELMIAMHTLRVCGYAL